MIESYSFGKMVIGGVEYKKDLILFENRVDAGWWRDDGHTVTMKDIEQIVTLKPKLIIFGTGAFGLMRVPQELRSELSGLGIDCIAEKTSKAVTFYNVRHKLESTIGAFHLTC